VIPPASGTVRAIVLAPGAFAFGGLKQQSRRRPALPSSPKLDGIVGLSKLGSELVVHLRPIFPLKEGGPSPTKAA
jgi:hypothetical protein